MAKRRTYDEVRGRGDTDRRQREAEGETRRAGNTLCAHSYEFPAIKYHSKIARRNSIFVKWRLDAPVTDPRCIRVRRSHAIMGCADHSKFGWMHLLFRQGNLTIPISIRRFERIILANDASKRVKYLEIHQRRYFSCQRKGKIFFLSPSIEARRHESRRFFLRSFRFFPLLVHGRSTVYRSSKPPLPCPTWWFRVWLVHSLAR